MKFVKGQVAKGGKPPAMKSVLNSVRGGALGFFTVAYAVLDHGFGQAARRSTKHSLGKKDNHGFACGIRNHGRWEMG